jgi:phosphohistidine phosphatase
MDLILWRHAEAHPARPGQTDLERTLSAKGTRQAKHMAAWLEPRLPENTKILVSPAVRTRQTVQALDWAFQTSDALLPDASAMALLSAVRWPDAGKPVLMVGHQPTLGQLASLLLAEVAQPWTIKKGAVWWLRQRVRGRVSQVVLHAVLSPDSL